MWAWPELETIPFHLIWISLTILYGFRVWPLRRTALVLAVVCAASTAALAHAALDHGESLLELVEVPLMAGVFVAMGWHARRRQTALDRVRRSAERERDFVRDASHLLRTPITVARGHAELLADAASGQERDDLEIVVDELGQLSRIADRLLLLASAEDPRSTALAPVDAGGLLCRTVERWRPVADRDWRCEDGARGTLLADEDRLRCALDALVENAVRATLPGGRIEIRTRAQDGALVLEVADDGGGIDPELLPRAFERFARGSGGTGLGLPIVRAIAAAHGGSVSISSEIAHGTTVRMRLPSFTSAHADDGAVTAG
jgi:signal transduction histidine kinase